jgi:hypothetical protein
MTRWQVAGVLLVVSFGLWLPVALLPVRVWTAPLAERLDLIAERRRTWQAVNLAIAGAAVLLVLGVAALAAPLAQAGGGVLVPLSVASLVLGAALWLISLAFRVWPMAAVAGSQPPPGLELAAAWAGGLFVAWSWLGNVSVALLGAAIVHADRPADWCGWAAIALSGLILVQLLVTGDSLPALYHVAPALIGVALLSE